MRQTTNLFVYTLNYLLIRETCCCGNGHDVGDYDDDGDCYWWHLSDID